MTEALHVKHRPKSFDEVLGQDATVNALETIVKKGGAQQFLFSGPSGTGKTTIARITAEALGADKPGSVLEIDAATHTGVEHMRDVQDVLQYMPMGGGKRAIIVDEAHRLSKQAWESLLKPIEEPPAHVIWLLCTTELGKVPNTIKTRCASFTLKPVSDKDLLPLVCFVAKAERVKLADGVAEVIVKEANGSPRQALSNLTVCLNARTKKEAAEVLRSVQDTDGTIELARFLLQGGSWPKAMSIIKTLDGENPESIRMVVLAYLSKVLINAKSDAEATVLLTKMDPFSQPFNASEKLAPLLIAVGRAIYSPT